MPCSGRLRHSVFIDAPGILSPKRRMWSKLPTRPTPRVRQHRGVQDARRRVRNFNRMARPGFCRSRAELCGQTVVSSDLKIHAMNASTMAPANIPRIKDGKLKPSFLYAGSYSKKGRHQISPFVVSRVSAHFTVKRSFILVYAGYFLVAPPHQLVCSINALEYEHKNGDRYYRGQWNEVV